MKIGYFLSSEEWGPRDLVAQAVEAQEAGFEGLWISDHYHPWNDEQGHSPFVWSTIGAIAQATDGMKVTTAVTCPTIRIHPGDRRAGRRHLRRPAGRQFLPRVWGAERRSTSTSSATVGLRRTSVSRCSRRPSR